MKEYIFEIYEETTADGGHPSKMKEELVRCKDCKYMTGHDDTDGNVQYWICSEWDGRTEYDGYCHYGERRKE